MAMVSSSEKMIGAVKVYRIGQSLWHRSGAAVDFVRNPGRPEESAVIRATAPVDHQLGPIAEIAEMFDIDESGVHLAMSGSQAVVEVQIAGNKTSFAVPQLLA
ncbi:MAG TPA: hypothetical protein VJ302_32965 [Blastocatellia bacterium]|nr:hypothetical protein [Blastocatellia bacterium]